MNLNDKKIQKMIYLPESVLDAGVERAREEDVSFTRLVEKAVDVFVCKNERAFYVELARMTNVEKRLQYLGNKSETFYKLAYYMLPMLFARLPELPKDVFVRRMDVSVKKFEKNVRDFRKKNREENMQFSEKLNDEVRDDG